MLTIFMVMISRMFLGGHSLDQVIFGFIVAGCVIIVYEMGGLKQKISDMLINFNKISTKTFLFRLMIACHIIALWVYMSNY